jgi:hypothetical protein
MMDIIIQIIGVLALTANFVSFQMKKHRHILFFRTVNEGLFILQYFLLGAFSGSVLNIVGCVRNIIFAKQVIHNKKTIFSTVVFCIIFTAFGIATFDGLGSIMLIFAKVLSTIAYGNKNTTVVRVVSFITHIGYLIYNLSVFSIAGALGDIILLVSLVCSILRLDIMPRIKNDA